MADILNSSGFTALTEGSTAGYLLKANYLAEFAGSYDILRNTLDVYSKSETNDAISESTKKVATELMDDHLLGDDPHGIKPYVDELLKKYVKTSILNSFSAPQSYANNVLINSQYDLVHAKYVIEAIEKHEAKTDVHGFKRFVEDQLGKYTLKGYSYDKDQVYTKNEVQLLLNNVVRLDAENNILGRLKVKAPDAGSDAVNKTYVDNLVKGSYTKEEIDYFIKKISNSIEKRAFNTDVYYKRDTMSTPAIKRYVDSRVNLLIDEAIANHIAQYNHGEFSDAVSSAQSIQLMSDDPGISVSLPGAPTGGIIAKAPTGPTTAPVCDDCCHYTGHGPTDAPDVGFITTGTDLSEPMCYQDLLDKIFYNLKVEITADPSIIETGTCKDINVTMKYIGKTPTDIDLHIINAQGETIQNYVVNSTTFPNGIKVVVINICEETTFKMVAHYASGGDMDDSCTVTATPAMYVGLLPKWVLVATIDRDRLNDLCETTLLLDTGTGLPVYSYTGMIAKVLGKPSNGDIISLTVNFPYDGVARHPFIMYPSAWEVASLSNPNPIKLDELNCVSQAFEISGNVTSLAIKDCATCTTSTSYRAFVYVPAITSWNNVSLSFSFKNA